MSGRKHRRVQVVDAREGSIRSNACCAGHSKANNTCYVYDRATVVRHRMCTPQETIFVSNWFQGNACPTVHPNSLSVSALPHKWTKSCVNATSLYTAASLDASLNSFHVDCDKFKLCHNLDDGNKSTSQQSLDGGQIKETKVHAGSTWTTMTMPLPNKCSGDILNKEKKDT